MTRKPDHMSPESVLAKVRNQARPGLTPHNAQVIFILERFLARVARSAHRDRFVLKGGILLYLTERSMGRLARTLKCFRMYLTLHAGQTPSEYRSSIRARRSGRQTVSAMI